MSEILTFGSDFSAFGTHAERVQAIVVAQSKKEAPAAWSVLPTLNGPRDWLLVAATQNGQRLGLEQLRAFIGPDIARTEPSSSVPAGPNARYQTFVRVAGNRGVDFLDGIELMLRVQATQPPGRVVVATPLASLLGDFGLETRGRDGKVDRERVRTLYARIDSTGLLSLENLRFLKVQMLAACGNWRELVELDWFDELCRTRRPIKITHRLLEAVWKAHFDELEVGEDPGNAISAFEERDLGHRYASLLRAVDETTSKQGRRLLMLAARSSGDRARCERVLASAPKDEQRWLARLGGLDDGPTESTGKVDPLDPIDVAFQEGAWGLVLELILQLGVIEPANARRLVEAAYELDDQSRCKSVADAIADVDLTDELQSRAFREHFEWVRDAAGDHCASWTEWARKAATEHWPQAFRTVEESCESWSIAAFQHDQESAEFAIRLLEAFDGPNRVVLRQALASLCDLAAQLFSEPAAEDVIFAVLEVLSADENPSPQVRAAFIEALDGALRSGASAARYEQLIETGTTLWDSARSPGNIEWLLDLLETVVMWPCPVNDVRLNLVLNAANDFRRFAAEVAQEARAIVDEILDEFGGGVIDWPEVDNDVAQGRDVWATLAGKTVGLYSLVANIGARLEAKLIELCPGVQVLTNADTVNSGRLQALARSADYMIVDWRHASHAATGGIDAVRDRGDQILPAGGGVSSFLSALKEALVAEGAVA